VKCEAREWFRVSSWVIQGDKFSDPKLETRNPKREHEESRCALQFQDKS
jgi:hypothetical protein